MSRMLDDLYLPDGKRLTSQIVGKPGSGKSYYLTHTIDTFLKKHKDPAYRLIYICPKQEVDLGEKNPPIGVDKLEKRLKKNRVAVVYPNPHYVDAEVDYCIDLIFSIQQANPDFSCTIIIDDAQTFISSRKAASPSFRRLALTGRSKNIRFVAVAHQMVFSKDLEGSTSYLALFSMPVKLYHKDAERRYGLDVEPFIEPLAETPYSFVWFDVTKNKAQLYEPIEVKGKITAA